MRRRGELSKSSIDTGWPHQVALPNTQAAAQSPAIRAFVDGLSLCNRGHTFVRDSQYMNVFCFADREHAQRFASEFGGEIIDPKDRPRWPNRKTPRKGTQARGPLNR
jgi:hypothetical protein